MLGAKLSLMVKPESLADDERPAALAQVAGTVARLAEQVLCPRSLLDDLFQQYRDRILLVDGPDGVRFALHSPGEIASVRLRSPVDGGELVLKPRQVVLTAGAGNARLRKLAGLDDAVMQRRPLHMTLVRGALPALNGHCVDGARTRVTITSSVDAQDRTVWQVGGQAAEDGVALSPVDLTRRVQGELSNVLPGVSFDDTEWSTHIVDRAEGLTPKGTRPETIQVLCAGNVTTGWPTKLALAPALASEIAARISAEASPSAFDPSPLADWPRPAVADLPWEEASRSWWRLSPDGGRTVEPRKAA
jgi:hypothetical protein